MQFSLGRFLILIGFISLIVASLFALPNGVGHLIILAISLFVLPPIVVVGVVHTRGVRQAFCLGAMAAGLVHFIFAVYTGLDEVFLIAAAISEKDGFDNLIAPSDEDLGLSWMHAVPLSFSVAGGCSGSFGYWYLKPRPSRNVDAPKDHKDD